MTQSILGTHTQQVLNTESALAALRAALESGKNHNVAPTIFIVGPNLEKIAFASADGATPHSRSTALLKAQTSASTRRASGWMPADLAIELPMASGGLLTNIPGGAPITVNGETVGAIGIAGGTVQQDAAILQDVIEAIGSEES